ncbi:LysR family transcriptional regulator [Cryptosporangium phraense]|uniref:LysR family transcriptional regulator n=1 Tax=Cryptosporangium phraense TaxID=2593070 RepID=A0A545AZC5_9ACTN|nr:LysR family transcriptional regulator [Cryptosporangium phraense]
MEVRELTYFVAVAEERHFGRAAARLGIAQPPLSRAIKAIEHRVGVPLFERTSRGVLLTAAGEVLLEDARRLLEASTAAVARARRAGSDQPRLVLVLKPGADGGMLAEVLREYEHAPDAVPVDLHTCGFREHAGLLRAGVGDVALIYGKDPDLAGLDSEELFREGQILVVAQDHPLAARPSITMDEVHAQPTPLWTGDGSVPRQGELPQLVALGRWIHLAPISAGHHLRRDVAAVPVSDAPELPVLLAWPEQHRSKALASFVRTAVDIAAERRSLR